MELSKQDIQKIDNYLKKGIKYWDIRLEMIDHLASELEQKNDIIIDDAFLKSRFGLYYTMKNNMQPQIKLINKKYKKLFFKGFLGMFKSFNNVLIFTFLVSLSVIFYHFTNFKQMLKLQLILTAISIFVLIFIQLINYKKTFYSINFGYIYTYSLSLILVFLQLEIYLFKPNGFFHTPENTSVLIFSILFVIYLFWMYNGYTIFKKTLSQYKKINFIS